MAYEESPDLRGIEFVVKVFPEPFDDVVSLLGLRNKKAWGKQNH
jgi:hypothetical protein